MAGIDYGMGKTNIDKETGIRYGVINLNSEGVSEWAWESFEGDYGPATCGKCGATAVEYDSEKHEDGYEHEQGCSDWACEMCQIVFDSQDAYDEEPIGWELDDGEYLATASSDGDAFIIKSPYYTFADFCSPCAPGACHLESPSEDGEKTYCLGHSWFQGGVAPYAVYRVDSGQRVYPVGASPEKGNDVPNQSE